MADLVSNMLLKLKADTSQAKSEIRNLRGEEKKAAEARLKEIDKINKAHDETIATWGKVAGAIGLVIGTFKGLEASVNSYLTNMRAATAASGSDIGRLRKATSGLTEDTELLLTAGKLMNGHWKFTQSEMERVFRGMTAVRKLSGVDMPEALKKFSEALSKGTTEELKQFGIQAKDKQGVLRELDELFNKLGGDVTVAGDEFIKTNVNFKNAMDEVKTSIGEIVVAMAPLVSVVADLAREAAQLISQLRKAPGVGFRALQGKTGGASVMAKAEELWDSDPGFFGAILDRNSVAAALSESSGAAAEYGNMIAALIDMSRNKGVRSGLSDFAGRFKGKKKTGSRGKSGGIGTIDLSDVFGSDADQELDVDNFGREIEDELAKLEPMFDAVAVGVTRMSDSIPADWKQRVMAEKTSVLEQFFGTPAQIEAQALAIGVAKDAFDSFAQAVGSGWEAMILGSEGFVTAFKRAMAQSLVAISTEQAIMAVKEGAMALGALAIGNFPGAAAHGAAAGQHLAAAGVAAAGARLLGAGAGAKSGSSTSARGGSVGAPRLLGPGGGGASSNERNITINMGGDYLGMTAQERAAAMARAIKTARKGSQTIRRQ